MGKRDKGNSENFILKLPLKTELWQEHILNKRFEICRKIYNSFQNKMIKRFAYISQMNDFKKCKTKKEKSDFLKNFYSKNSGKSGIFSEYGFKSEISVFKHFRNCGINSTILEFIADCAWASWNKVLYGNGKRISFKRKDEFNFYNIRKKCGVFNGILLNKEKCLIDIKLNEKNGSKSKYMTIPFIVNKKSEYEMFAFSPDNEIRCIGLQREIVRGKYKYYILFTFEGKKPMKNRKLGKGNVGIDLGPSTIAVSSNKKVFIDELASDIDKIEDKLSLLQRKLDRSLRNTNLENFNQNGTIRKGRGVKLVWKKSKRCHNIQKQIKELYRIQRVKRKLSHINLANSLLELGDVFNVENNPISAWAVRSKETKVRKDGRIQSKKRFGKSIANHAPSMFVTILENKVKSLGGYLNKIDIKNAASQYDFTNGLKTKHELKERNVTLSNNNVHLRDTIAAFNIQHFDSNKLEYDVDNMKRDYEIFVKLEKEEIDRHKHLSVKKIQSLIQNLNNKTVIFYNSKGKLLQYVINNKVVDIIQNGNTGIYTVIENNKVVNKLFSINQYGHIKEKVIDNVYPYTYNGKLIILYKDDRLHFIDSETLNEIVSFETNGLDNNQILSTNGGILTFNNRILQILNTK